MTSPWELIRLHGVEPRDEILHVWMHRQARALTFCIEARLTQQRSCRAQDMIFEGNPDRDVSLRLRIRNVLDVSRRGSREEQQFARNDPEPFRTPSNPLEPLQRQHQKGCI